MKVIAYLLFGMYFGAVLVAAQVFHWHRIQEMFHFESFHMYGVLGSAILTGAIGVWIIKRFKLKSIQGTKIELKKKPLQWFANSLGGLSFGLGWGITGACTAPLFILVGYQWQIGLIAFLGAFVGVLLFAALKNKLPQ